MSRRPGYLGGPPELQDAIDGHVSFTALPSCGVYRLLKLAHAGHGDYTWGYRIYRTTYLRHDSDTRFAKAIEVINEYIRYECSTFDTTNRPKSVEHLDAKASEQLRQRLKHDILEDRELLEGASENPDKILKLAQDWVHLDQKAKTGDSPRYRFFLVIDDEAIDHLLQLPMPARPRFNIPTVYSVKVYDARVGPPSQYSGGESNSDSDAESEDSDWEGFEGWFWSPACYLTELWFCDYKAQEELLTTDYSWDQKRRYIPSKAALNWLPLNETIDEWRQAELQQEVPDQSAPTGIPQDTSV
jgi:hypothetical protein